MKERGIPFQASMVRAVNREVDPKTQTRRIVNPQPVHKDGGWTAAFLRDGYFICYPLNPKETIKCPYGVPGDRLWVREAWRIGKGYDELPGAKVPSNNVKIWYEADGSRPNLDWVGRYRYARFMPRWASRTTLEVVAVRVERLQEISEADAIAEGIDGPLCAEFTTKAPSRFELKPAAVHAYAGLIESINGAGTWAANPWVWVVEFKRIPQP